MCNVFLIKKTMAPQLCRLGVGAKCSCLSWFVHPLQHIRGKYPNPVSGHRLEGCLTIHQEVKKVSGQDQLCVIIHHDDFKMADGENSSNSMLSSGTSRSLKKEIQICSLMIQENLKVRVKQHRIPCLMLLERC